MSRIPPIYIFIRFLSKCLPIEKIMLILAEKNAHKIILKVTKNYRKKLIALEMSFPSRKKTNPLDHEKYVKNADTQ